MVFLRHWNHKTEFELSLNEEMETYFLTHQPKIQSWVEMW